MRLLEALSYDDNGNPVGNGSTDVTITDTPPATTVTTTTLPPYVGDDGGIKTPGIVTIAIPVGNLPPKPVDPNTTAPATTTAAPAATTPATPTRDIAKNHKVAIWAAVAVVVAVLAYSILKKRN